MKIHLKQWIATSNSFLIASIFFAPLIQNFGLISNLKYLFFSFNIVTITIYLFQNNFKINLLRYRKQSLVFLSVFFLLFSIVSILHYNGNLSYVINYILLLTIFVSLAIIYNCSRAIKLFSNLTIFLLIIYLSLAAFNLFNFLITKTLVFNFYSLEYYRLNKIFRLGMGLEDPNFISMKILIGFFLNYFIVKNKFLTTILLFFMFLSLSVAFTGILFVFYMFFHYKKIFKVKYLFFISLLLFGFFYLIFSNELLFDILSRKFVDTGSSTGESSLMVSIESRLEQYIIGVKVLYENIFGIGAGNFVTVATEYCIQNGYLEALNLQGTFHDFHNSLFQILICGGIVSFVVFMFFCFSVYKNLKTYELKIFFFLFLLLSATINASNVLQFWLMFLLFLFIPFSYQFQNRIVKYEK
jgi:hypothetical protein